MTISVNNRNVQIDQNLAEELKALAYVHRSTIDEVLEQLIRSAAETSRLGR